MTSRDFCYWLQGFFEINRSNSGLDAVQADVVKRHLSMVFLHEIDPSFPADQQAKLDEIHVGPPASAASTTVPKIGGTDAQGNVMRC